MDALPSVIAVLTVTFAIPLLCLPTRIVRSVRVRSLRRQLQQRATPTDYRELSHVDLAYLVGGPKRALVTAMAEVAAGRPGHYNTLSGYLASRDPRAKVSSKDLFRDAKPYLEQLSQQLSDRGLTLSTAELTAVNRTALIVRRITWIVFFVAAAVLLVVGSLSGEAGEAGFMILFAFIWARIWVPPKRIRDRFSANATKIVLTAIMDFKYLDPAQRPAYQSYGPWAPTLATALFGGSVIALAFPAWAELPLVSSVVSASAASSSGGSACSTSGCSGDSGGGDSCGGGGCGGGD